MQAVCFIQLQLFKIKFFDHGAVFILRIDYVIIILSKFEFFKTRLKRYKMKTIGGLLYRVNKV